jgi:hypothetical protein
MPDQPPIQFTVHTLNTRPPRRSLGCLPALITTVLMGGILLGIGVAVLSVFAPNILNGLVGAVTNAEMIQTRPVAGDPTRFDPIASFESIQAFAGEGAQLVELEARFVRADGTLDLTATYTPSPTVDVEFALAVEPPADAPPVGAGGGGQWYREITISAFTLNQTRRVTTSGGGFRTSYTYTNEGMTRDIDDARRDDPTFIAAPTCPFADLWAVAIERGAPPDAVAIIDYDDEGYEFRISDAGVRLEFDAECRLIDG